MGREPWMKKSKQRTDIASLSKVVALLVFAMLVADGVIGFFEGIVQNPAIAMIAYVSVLALVNTKLFGVLK